MESKQGCAIRSCGMFPLSFRESHSLQEVDNTVYAPSSPSTMAPLLAEEPVAYFCGDNERDRAFLKLYKAGVIDDTGLLSPHIDQRVMTPTPSVIGAIQSFLLTTLPGSELTVVEFLIRDREMAKWQRSPIESFSIIGSGVFYLLESMLQETLRERLGEDNSAILMQEGLWNAVVSPPRDWDLRSITRGATLEQLYCRFEAMTGNKAPPSRKKIDSLLIKISNSFEYTLGRYFSRFCLFDNSNLHLVIDPSSLTVTAKEIRVKIVSEERNGIQKPLQPIIDKLLKILRVHDPSTINHKGAILWHLLVAKGYLPVDMDSYSPLLETLLVQHKAFDNWSERVANDIINTVEMHCPKKPLLLPPLLLMLELTIPPQKLIKPTQRLLIIDEIEPHQKKLIHGLWEGLFPEKERTDPIVALRLSSTPADEFTGSLLAAVLKIGALLALATPGRASGHYNVELTAVGSAPTLCYQFSQETTTSHLLLPLELSHLITEIQALQKITLSKARQTLLFKILTNCFYPEAPTPEEHEAKSSVLKQHIDILAPPLEYQRELLATAEECMASQEPFFHAIAAALLVTLTAWGMRSAEEKLICEELPLLLKHQHSLLRQWGHHLAKELLLDRAAESQKSLIINNLNNLTAKTKSSLMDYFQVVLIAGDPHYARWIFQRAILKKESTAWLTAYQALRSSQEMGTLKGQLLQLMAHAEKLTTPLDITPLQWLSHMVTTHYPSEKRLLIPLEQCFIQKQNIFKICKAKLQKQDYDTLTSILELLAKHPSIHSFSSVQFLVTEQCHWKRYPVTLRAAIINLANGASIEELSIFEQRPSAIPEELYLPLRTPLLKGFRAIYEKIPPAEEIQQQIERVCNHLSLFVQKNIFIANGEESFDEYYMDYKKCLLMIIPLFHALKEKPLTKPLLQKVYHLILLSPPSTPYANDETLKRERRDLYRDILNLLFADSQGTLLAKYFFDLALTDKKLFIDSKALVAFFPTLYLIATTTVIEKSLDEALASLDLHMMEQALLAITEHPHCLNSFSLVSTVMDTLIHFYVFDGKKELMERWHLRVKVLAIAFECKLLISNEIESLAYPYFETNRPISLYLLLLERTIYRDYPSQENAEKAFQLAYETLRQLAEGYIHEEKALLAAFKAVMLTPLSHRLKNLNNHLKALSDKSLEKFHDLLLRIPHQALYYHFFVEKAAISKSSRLFPLFYTQKEEEVNLSFHQIGWEMQQLILQEVLMAHLTSPSWTSFEAACQLMRKRQNIFYDEGAKLKLLILVYELIIDSFKQLLEGDPEGLRENQLESFFQMVHNSDVLKEKDMLYLPLNSMLPPAVKSANLMHQVTKSLLSYTDQRTRQLIRRPMTQEKRHELAYLIGFASAQIQASNYYGIYQEEKELHHEHVELIHKYAVRAKREHLLQTSIILQNLIPGYAHCCVPLRKIDE